MKTWARNTILGIELGVSLTDRPRKLLVPIKGTPQDKPRRRYVYAHMTPDGKYFYIGQGVGRRAWSNERHFLWHFYVDKYLKGKYKVVILQDNLSLNKAEQLEADWIAQEGRTLVNWVNSERKIDLATLDRYNKLRDANRDLLVRAKALEKADLETASKMYLQAIAAFDEYADLDIACESGFVGRLLKESRSEARSEVGRSGNLAALNRLSLCLVKLGRVKEAQDEMQRYFQKYKADTLSPISERIKKRIEKALSKDMR